MWKASLGAMHGEEAQAIFFEMSCVETNFFCFGVEILVSCWTHFCIAEPGLWKSSAASMVMSPFLSKWPSIIIHVYWLQSSPGSTLQTDTLKYFLLNRPSSYLYFPRLNPPPRCSLNYNDTKWDNYYNMWKKHFRERRVRVLCIVLAVLLYFTSN